MSGQQTQNEIDFESWLSGEGALLLHGDSLEVLRRMPDNSVHAVVTDPPYGLGDTSPEQVAECVSAWARGEEWSPKGKGFMGKSWDAWVPPPALWREVLRVLRPGGHALVFASSRTQDLMSISMRLSGFEIRDTLQWLYSSGFPKSLNVDKAIDKHLGVEHLRPVVGEQKLTGTARKVKGGKQHGCAMAGTDIERQETVVELTEPYSEQAKMFEGYGTALKPSYEPIIMARKPVDGTVADCVLAHNGCGALNIMQARIGDTPPTADASLKGGRWAKSMLGRHPANTLFDEGAAEALEAQASGASRFFYCAKASKREREEGLVSEGLRANHHPTVKPIELMRYLVRLVTPLDGMVLDPFMGSGTTGCAAALEGKRFVGVEREAEYHQIAEARIAYWGGKTSPKSDPAKTSAADAGRTDQADSGAQLDLFGDD